MSVKHNEKGAWPKVCIGCADDGIETVLNPGVNCYLSMYKNGSYKCKVCKKKQSKVEHDVKWRLPDFRAHKAAYLHEYHREEPAGVYAIYYDLDIIYIGESSLPEQRRICHFSKYIKSKEQLDKGQWQQRIPYDLATGELDRKRLSFEVIHYEQDKKLRMKMEQQMLHEHFNAFGSYPKYNVDYTGKKRTKHN